MVAILSSTSSSEFLSFNLPLARRMDFVSLSGVDGIEWFAKELPNVTQNWLGFMILILQTLKLRIQ